MFGRFADVLLDFPTSYDSWGPDRDLLAAKEAARRQSELERRRERLGLGDGDPDDPQKISDDVDCCVLLYGRYVESPNLQRIRDRLRATMPEGMEDFLGETFVGGLETNLGTIAVHGIPTDHDQRHVWVVGTIGADRDEDGWSYTILKPFPMSEVPGVLPRWPGLTRGACAARSLMTLYYLTGRTAAIETTPQAEGIANVLRGFHAPFNAEEAHHASQEENKDIVRQWLQAVLAESHGVSGAPAGGDEQADATVMPAPRMLKGHAEAEAYAAEVLSALGFTGIKGLFPDEGVAAV